MLWYAFNSDASDYKIADGFVSDTAGLLDELDEFVELYYAKDRYKENLRKGIILPSDQKPNRKSFAFIVNSSGINRDSTEISLEKIPRNIRLAQNKIKNEIGVNFGAILFNVQYYYFGSEFIVEHHDGYFLHSSNDRGSVHSSIRPLLSTVLTLKDENSGLGTNIHSPYGIKRVVTKPGDLLIFNNVNQTHSVDMHSSLSSAAGSQKKSPIRVTVGWRSVEEQCAYWTYPDIYRIVTPHVLRNMRMKNAGRFGYQKEFNKALF